MELMNARGTKDFLPEQKILRQKIVDVLREVFELYGYPPLETPLIERFEVLSAKFTGGAEILKETFSFKDQGKRDLGLRYDLTVPFSRVIAMNPRLKMPFKRYQIGRVFRDGPVKLGRAREFWQCDVDIVGAKGMLADAETVAIASEAFKRLGINVIIKINSRKVLDAVMIEAGVSKDKIETAILTLDKLEKIGEKGVLAEFKDKGIDGKKVLKIVKEGKLKNNEGLEELKQIEGYLKGFGVKNYKIDYTLARGLSYYTGTVFEAVCDELDSSLAGGGRYDKMIGGFIGKGDYPAVGISFGLEPIYEVLKEKEGKKSVVDLYVIPIGTLDESLKIISDLRSKGIKCDIDFNGRNVSKNLKYANKMEIPYVLIIGEDELKTGKFSLKNMKSGKEEKLVVSKIVKRVDCIH
jgi:histidyl-tRNA synthetase